MKISTNVYLTSVQTCALVEHTTDVEISNDWSPGLDLAFKGNPAFECTVLGYDMGKVVRYLLSLGKVRYTDHEYRGDTRDIVWVQGFPMDPHEQTGTLIILALSEFVWYPSFKCSIVATHHITLFFLRSKYFIHHNTSVDIRNSRGVIFNVRMW